MKFLTVLFFLLVFSLSTFADDVRTSIKSTIAGVTMSPVDDKLIVLDNKGTLAKYGTDGIFDGRFKAPIFSGFKPSQVLMQGEKVLVVGFKIVGFEIVGFGMTRLNHNGSTDKTFGKDGSVTTELSGYSYETVSDVKVLKDGKILLVGRGLNIRTNVYNGIVARYTANGTLDTTFGKSGMAIYQSQSMFTSAEVQSDGKLLIGGQVGYKPAVLRLTSNGSLDNSFSGGVRVGVKDGVINDIKEKNGKIVAVGHILVPVGNRMAVSRFNNDGSLDRSFNSLGYKELVVGNGTSSALRTIIEDNDDITVIGNSTVGTGTSKDPRYSSATAIKLSRNGDVNRTLVYDYKVQSGFSSLVPNFFVCFTMNLKGQVTMIIKDELR